MWHRSLLLDFNGIMVSLWHLTFLISIVGSAPMPPRLPHQAIERFNGRQHLKEDSPVHCSRAVSRWVRQAWNMVLADSYKTADPTMTAFSFGATLGPACPFESSGDLYKKQELLKESHGLHGAHKCGICHKTFKTEYHLDCHFDRRHSFNGFRLPDSYRGGDVTDVVDVVTNSTLHISPDSPRLARWAPCLEDFCQIFDVCDRPPSRRHPLVHNDLSITHPSQFNITVNSSDHPVDGACNSQLLPSLSNQCHALIDSCFPVDTMTTTVRRANIYIKRHLCGALVNCGRYLTRRQYSGSSLKYTQAAYFGEMRRPINAMPGYQIALIAVGSVGLVFAVVASACCCLSAEDSSHMEPRSSETKPYAYKSAMEHVSPAARRRIPIQSVMPRNTVSGVMTSIDGMGPSPMNAVHSAQTGPPPVVFQQPTFSSPQQQTKTFSHSVTSNSSQWQNNRKPPQNMQTSWTSPMSTIPGQFSR